ncbi:YjbH domain-containing protein [Pseudoduganella sp. GCM10020061]|uniref:YjbH domain-containing protein n=1 Tax=Pseudoduganella sp. GCM10020061 TaxID=3317345 RepID=UPI003626F965
MKKSRFFYFVALASPFLLSDAAFAQEIARYWSTPSLSVPSLATTGPSGTLNLPNGRTIADGVLAFGYNNHLGAGFTRFRGAKNYQFVLGLMPHLEISARLAEMPRPNGTLGIRDLSANVKFMLPRFVAWQPNIAVGVNDLSGGASFFKSKYVSMSDSYGPVRWIIGASRGEDYLGNYFASAELPLWRTGASVILERNGSANNLGVRYESRTIPFLANSSIVATAQRAFKTNTPAGKPYDRSAFGINLVIPVGENGRIWDVPARSTAPAAAVAAAYPAHRVAQVAAPAQSTPPASATARADSSATAAFASNYATAAPAVAAADTPRMLAGDAMARIWEELVNSGLERVRVGKRGAEMVVEYENHRYNQNEVDAVGIALGAGVALAPEEIRYVSVVTKKAGLQLYKTTVEKTSYRRFLEDGQWREAQSALSFQFRPDGGWGVQWLDTDEGPRGYSRIRVEPRTVHFVGTEKGLLDYSLAANIQAYVPVWKGAELSTSYLETVHESDDVAHGFLGWAQQRNGLRTAILSQAVWLTDNIVNVTSAGKYLYDLKGVQNETTWFVPGTDDQVRVQYTHLREEFRYRTDHIETGAVSYMWNYAPLNATVEAGYQRYRGEDQGPFLQVSRWFGDVQAQAYVKKSEIETRVGFGLAIPLTPRKGMKPGWTHIEGSGSYMARVETKLASSGECNCINMGVVEEFPMAYSARAMFFNQGRIGREYIVRQMPRMRNAFRQYTGLMN